MIRHPSGTPPLTLVLALSTLACASSPPSPSKPTPAPPPARSSAPAAPPAPPPFDVDVEMKREASGLSDRVVRGPGDVWSVSVPASGEPQLSTTEHVTLVAIPVAPNVEVRCQVHDETVDPAGTLFGVIKESSARVEYKLIEPSALRLFGGAPAAGITALYTTQLEGGEAVGGLKLAVLTGEHRSLLCLLDDLGYAQTFERVSAAFFESFTAPGDPKSEASYTEVTRARLDEVDVGFGVTRILPGDAPGEREYHHLSTHLVPEAASAISFDDAFTILRFDARGRLQRGNWAEASSGELVLQIELNRAANGTYALKGQVEGRPVQGPLKAPQGIATALDVAALLKKKLLQRKPFSENVAEYHPSIDPLATVTVTYSRTADAPPRQVLMQLGERRFTAEIDEDGVAKDGWFDLGEQRLTITRQHLSGRW